MYHFNQAVNSRQGPNVNNVSDVQKNVERVYRRWARIYDWLTPLYLMGNESRLRRETIDSLDLHTGQKVLEIGCGTGRNFSMILERIGPEGRLLGVDYTAAMLDRARARIQRHGWKNVELIQADASTLDLECQFDAALSTLAIAVIPDSRSAFDRMAAHI